MKITINEKKRKISKIVVYVPVYHIPLTTLAMPFRIRGFGTVQFPYTIGDKIDLHCTMFLQGRRAVVYRYIMRT